MIRLTPYAAPSQTQAHCPVPIGRSRLSKAWLSLCLLISILAVTGSIAPQSAPAQLTTVEFHVGGTGLQVSPAVVSVPKGIAGSVRIDLLGSDSSLTNPQNAYVEALLRGPGLSEPRRLVGAVNQALLFPPLNLVGDYQLSDIRLVKADSGETLLEGTPNLVPVRVFDEVLVSRVTSRPLTLDEIQEKGIFIDESNFKAVEFEAAFVLDGQTIPIRFPVISPKFKESTEIIPAAELEARLAEAAVLNAKIASEVVQLPPEFQTASLNIEIQGINFQPVDPAEDAPLALKIPPIPALMVIPGNIGYLNQFFSVQIFTENASPAGSGLNVRNIQATLKLPPGPDRIPASDYASPGDDPLRFARVGPQKIIQPQQTIAQPGPDGKPGTADDVGQLNPGQSGQAEFLVEGLQEGLHVMDLDLVADLDGLAAGTVKVKGKAAGSVLVRNPRFSMAFAHPRTVRTGEPYEASVTLLNTGNTPANLVQVTLNKNSISGARLEDESLQTVQLGTILPGQTATARFRMRSLRTGSVQFSNLTTSDDSIEGRFKLSMGVDERGVALSPDTIGMPDFVNDLPEAVQFAATRVLGQALSVATAAQLPPSIQGIPKSIVTRRVIELAEAGQRLRYNDPLPRVLADLLLDWQGGREAQSGFDQILRETDAGREWREAILATLRQADPGTTSAPASLLAHAPDLAGLGQSWILGAASTGDHWLATPTLRTDRTRSAIPYHLVYNSISNGLWSTAIPSTNYPIAFYWSPTSTVARLELSVALLQTNGTGRSLSWSISNPPTSAVYKFGPDFSGNSLQVDRDGDGTFEGSLAGTTSTITEPQPSVIAVEQDLTILAGRPFNPCVGPQNIYNYGTVVAVVFSKPMTQATAGNDDSYSVDGGNGANSAQIQPGGRVVYLNLRKGVSAIRQRTLSFHNITDARGNALATPSMPIRSVVPGTTAPFLQGVAVKGRALRGNGQPATGIPVTLTMYDRAFTGLFCEPWTRRVSQVFTDSKGAFDFDFVLAGIPYSISATDTSDLTPEALAIIAESTAEGEVDRQRIEELANSDATRNTLLGAFAAGSLPQAIAKVEGLDRALVRDMVQMDSSRVGQEVPVALRFRGRAVVSGQVFSENGVTPVSGAAVNLFPDLDSRELGRGLLADEEGRFAFYGVPLGVFSIEVATSDRRSRTVSGLISTPDEATNIVITLPSRETTYAQFTGRVFDSDNITPQPNARVFLGRMDSGVVRDVLRIVTADGDGYWEAKDVPLQQVDVIAVSFDGKRKGTRLAIRPQTDVPNIINVALEATTRVFGRVQFEDGRPAPNALVAGGEALVRTDNAGYFTLSGVPLGSRQFSAGIERNPQAGIAYPRLGSTTADILPGADNFIVIKFSASGRIFGKVMDANGKPQPGIRVAIPIEGGFFWTDADGAGNYVFENLNLGGYTLSAPANAVFKNTIDVRALNEKIRSGNQEEILAAFEEAISVFVGANDPLLTGAQLNFRPSSWGYTQSQLRFDGESVEANIRYIAQGSVTGQVINHQGVPIGARVRLTGIGPAINGEPKMTIRGELDSDPATGLFIFPGNLLAGPWTLQAASPFYPVILNQNGFTTELDPNVTNIVLKFPPIREVNGRVAGRVLRPDGSPVGEGVRVHINFSDDYEIRTGTNGVFDTQIAIPAGGYRATAFDAESGLKGESYFSVTAGITNFIDVQLLTKNSAIKVVVLRGNGQPAARAQVDLEQGSYPRDPRITLIANDQGEVTFTDLWEGNYAVCSQYLEGATRLYARTGTSVGPNATTSVTLRLGATGSLIGQFLKRDLITPVAGAQVSIGNLGFASTDDQGRFRFNGVPIGTYRLLTSDPVSGAAAQASVTLTVPDQEVSVQIVEGARGEVNGFVVDSYGQGYVAGASVQITFSDGLTPSRTVTTGPDGRFSFPGAPVGNFSLIARDLPKSNGGRGVSGSTSGTLSEPTLISTIDIQLQQLGILPIQVLREDGTTPADNVHVTLGGFGTFDTGPSGLVTFTDIPLRSIVTARAISARAGNQFSGASASTTINQIGTNSTLKLVLRGSGKVSGQIVGSNGSTPISGAEVTIQFQAPLFSGTTRLVISGSQGQFTFDDVPVGAYRVSAQNISLAGSVSGDIAQHQESDTITIRLGDSGTITGRLVRADGETPVENADLAVLYNSQSTNPGRASARTDATGQFEFRNIPLGPFHLTAAGPSFGGLIEIDNALATNGQILNLGSVSFDEEFPRVTTLVPANGTTTVPITASVLIGFSEALNPSTITPAGIYLRSASGKIESSLALQPDDLGIKRLVRITPTRPLVSEQTYEIIVVAGPVFGSGGQSAGSGPEDLVGRPLTSPVLSRFTTADNDPPQLVSIFPTNGAIQIDPRSIPRLTFNEAIRSTGFVFRVSGPQGDVSGSASVGLNGLALSFVPNTELRPNSRYSLLVSNIIDLAGNRSTNEPFSATFDTLDTLGPIIASVAIADGRTPVANATIPIVVTLQTNEAGASIRLTQDLTPLGSTTNRPYRFNVKLPATGTTTLRAIATDALGNDGPLTELAVTIRPNQAPTLQFVRVLPAQGPLSSGSGFIVDVLATDDNSIAELKGIVGGLPGSTLITTNGPSLRLQGSIPASANLTELQFFAEALDDQGLSTGQRNLAIPVQDATLPTLALNGPPAQTILEPGSNVSLVVQATDNVGVTSINVTTLGAFASSFSAPVSIPGNTTNFTQSITLPIPANAPRNNEPLEVQLIARDAAGNSSLTVSRQFKMADRTPPTLAFISPATNSTGIDVAINPYAIFSEPLDTNRISASTVELRRDPDNARIAATLTISQNDTRITLDPDAPLAAETTYRFILAGTLTDVSGNPLGTSITNTFRTSEFQLASPANRQPLVEGQTLKLQAGSATLVFSNIRYLANNTELGVVPAPFSLDYTLPLIASLGTNQLSFTAEALNSTGQRIASATSLITLYPANEDTDGDGVSNADELAQGMDPFTPNRPPSLSLPSSFTVVQGSFADFNVTASDPDANLNQIEVREVLGTNQIRFLDRILFLPSAQPLLSIVPAAASATPTLRIESSIPGPISLWFIARDAGGLSATQSVTLVTLADLDRDGIPDRDDPDIDGDGISNTEEIALGLNPSNPDSDDDSIPDAVERSGSNGFVTNPSVADTDRDGVPDGFEIALGTNPTNPSDGSPNVVINNRTVTFDGKVRLQSLTLTNGAVLTHPTSTLKNEPRLEIEVTTLVIDSTSRIDVSQRGYLGGLNGQNAGTLEGRTFGNKTDLGSTRRNGGTHAGYGGLGDAEQIVRHPYGSITDPNTLGAGGGSDSDPAGNGGGRIKITASNIILDGQLVANGGNGSRYAGGGAGGSISIQAATLSGTGSIQANGGFGGPQSGGGGGGRVAVVLTSPTVTPFDRIQSLGGINGRTVGTPGTTHFQQPGQLAQLRIEGSDTNNLSVATRILSSNGGTNTVVFASALGDHSANWIPGSLQGMILRPNAANARSFRVVNNSRSFLFIDPKEGSLTEATSIGARYSLEQPVGHFIARNGATVEWLEANQAAPIRRGMLIATEADLSLGARLTHPPSTSSTEYGLDIQITGALQIDSSSRIDVSQRGYLGGLSGDNASSGSGRTLGNTIAGGSTRRNGGSYGGLGAVGNAEQQVNRVYGNYSDPNELGSGGGSDSSPAGSGGGLLRIKTAKLVLDGQLLANGGDGSRYAGGGSGGAIRIETDSLEGSGSAQANGGAGGAESGGGGGGRVAVFYNLPTEAPIVLANLQANGGNGINDGGVGTVVARRGSEIPTIVIRNAGRETPLPTFAGEHLILDGATASGSTLNVSSLTLTNGAILTHDPSTITTSSSLEINTTTLTISEDSRIDVSGRGYLGGLNAANIASQSGRSLGNANTNSSTRRNGGSYGGLGAIGNTEQNTNPVYGLYSDPNELGSGGGSDSSPAGNGGGLVRITAQSITLEGQILANGFNGSRYAGGGSGGGIKLTVTSLSGSGSIQANGGNGGAESGGGGGGRIAILNQNPANIGSLTLQTGGGNGYRDGAPGTIYFKQNNTLGTLIVRGTGRETPLPSTLSNEILILDAATLYASQLNATSILLTNGATLTHPAPTQDSESRLVIQANRIDISSDSKIDVLGRGYPGGLSGYNAGSQAGRTLGNTTVNASTRRNGGSYGGLGAAGNTEQFVNSVYGNYSDPDELGSGGGSDSSPGGTGGGLIRITTQSLHVDGRISANGTDGSRYAGGGSGGGIRINTTSISGSGAIQATGGDAGAESGGGGGGRIALFYTSTTGFQLTQLTALGGTARTVGASGTLYVKQGNSLPQLVIRGTGRETPLPTTLSDEHLVIDGAQVSARNIRITSLTLTNNALLTHPFTDTESEGRIEIISSTLLIDPSSRIDVTGRGYLGGLSAENRANQSGRTYGNTLIGGSIRRNGGSYGGRGAFGNIEASPNQTYGSFRNPNEVGSGGGSDSGAAGSGGGLIQITTDQLILEGQIIADGGSGSRYAGGGSGGGIRIHATTLTGLGFITANGGNSGAESGTGGGGRIAVYHQNTGVFALNQIQSFAGVSGRLQGSPGSIYLESPANSAGQLYIDARGTNSPSINTPIYSLGTSPSSSINTYSLSDTNAALIPGSLIGLRLNPNATQSRGFTIVDNTATTITTDPADGRLTDVASPGNLYSAIPTVGHFAIRGGARVEFSDADQSLSERRGTLRSITGEITNDSVLTHPATTSTTFFAVDWTVEDTLTIDSTSRIDVSGLGFLGSFQPGNPDQRGRTDGNDPTNGSTRRNGGSYGGDGGIGNIAGNTNPLYGNPESPSLPGSGGGSDFSPAGSGGGIVKLYVANLLLNGDILANGANGSRYGGGGSGGSIWIIVRQLTGTGDIQADGGNSGPESGGGGGGRVAIQYQDAAGYDFAKLTALPGLGYSSGISGSRSLIQRTYIPPSSAPRLATLAVIYEIRVQGRTGSGGPSIAGDPSTDSVLIKWSGQAGQSFELQQSTDLVQWKPVAARTSEMVPGRFQAEIPTPILGTHKSFYRVRQIPSR